MYRKEHSEFDQAWKAIFAVFIFDFLEMFLPDVWKKIDFDRDPEDISHELDAMFPQAVSCDREADFLLENQVRK